MVQGEDTPCCRGPCGEAPGSVRKPKERGNYRQLSGSFRKKEAGDTGLGSASWSDFSRLCDGGAVSGCLVPCLEVIRAREWWPWHDSQAEELVGHVGSGLVSSH